MPIVWHYTTFVDFLDHWQSLLAGVVALLAAIIAVIVTIRIERWKARTEDKAELLKEIRVANAATMVAFGVSNTLLSSKKQLIRPHKDQFDRQKELIKEALLAQQKGEGVVIEFHADFRTLPPLTLPLSLLQSQIFEKLSVDKRPIALMTTLTQVSDGLNVSITKRNQLIDFYKTNTLPPNRIMALYFGFPFDGSQINQEYADLMQAIYAQTDDVIFFSSQLSKDLSEHGDQLAASFKKQFGRNAPRITKPDFSKARDADLMPDDKNYSDWFNMFVKRPEGVTGT
jgi:hypothetical protein